MSPFLGFENSELTIELPTGKLGRDEVGNAIALKVEVKIKALLQMPPLLSAQKKDSYPGVDASAIKLEGYCVEPMVLPLNTTPDNWYRCAWSGQSGWFYLISPINPPYGRGGLGTLLEETQGTAIVGWFQIKRSK